MIFLIQSDCGRLLKFDTSNATCNISSPSDFNCKKVIDGAVGPRFAFEIQIILSPIFCRNYRGIHAENSDNTWMASSEEAPYIEVSFPKEIGLRHLALLQRARGSKQEDGGNNSNSKKGIFEWERRICRGIASSDRCRYANPPYACTKVLFFLSPNSIPRCKRSLLRRRIRSRDGILRQK